MSETRITTDRAAMAREINATFRIGDRLTVDIDGIPNLPYTYTDTSAVHVYVSRPDGVQQCIDTAVFLDALKAGRVAKVTKVTVPLNKVTADGITRAMSAKPARVETVHLDVRDGRGLETGKTACGRMITLRLVSSNTTAEVTCKRCQATDRFGSAIRAEERAVKLAKFQAAGIRVGMVVKYIGDHGSTPVGTLGVVTGLDSQGRIGLWDDKLSISGWSFADPSGFARNWAEVKFSDLVEVGAVITYLGKTLTVTSVDDTTGTMLATSGPNGEITVFSLSDYAADLTRGHLVVKAKPAPVVKCESCHIATGTREFTVTGTFMGSMNPRTKGATFLLCVVCYRSAMATVDEDGHGTVYVYWDVKRVSGQPIKFDRDNCTRHVAIGHDQETQHMLARTTADMVDPGIYPMITGCGFDSPNHQRAYRLTRYGVDTVEYMTRARALGSAWQHNRALGTGRDATFACVEINPLSGETIEKVW